MAVNDFWKRCIGEDAGESGTLERISALTVQGALMDLALGAGSNMTAAEVKALMKLAPASDEEAEFDDLITSATSVTNANAFTQTMMRHAIAEGIFAAVALGEQNFLDADLTLIFNRYSTGEAVRRRARDLISALGGTPVGTLAVADQ